MMKVCVACGSLVRHWIDKKTGEIHFQCVGCRKKWTEAGRDGQSQDQEERKVLLCGPFYQVCSADY